MRADNDHKDGRRRYDLNVDIHPRSNWEVPRDQLQVVEPEWEIEKILDSRFLYGRLQYLVKWLGWPDSENTWQDEIDLENAKEAVTTFHKEHPSAPRRLSDGTKTGKQLTKKRRGRKRIGCLEMVPLEVQTDVSFWPNRPMFRDETS